MTSESAASPHGDGFLDTWLAGEGSGRALVVVAHPDDEVLGCGTLLRRLRDVHVVHVTDGAPRDEGDMRRHGFASPAAYAAARAEEAREALRLAGVAPARVSTLGIPDQEASRHLAEIAERLAPLVAEAGLVLTHAFEGGHSDHDAVAFAVHAAWEIAPHPRPLLAEMPFYHAAPAGGWRRQTFVSQPAAGPERTLTLDLAEQDLKRRMLAAHRSQGETLASFELTPERFRLAPAYDFTVRPHGGDLLYERHGWGLDWMTWVMRVRDAEAALGMARA